MTNLNQCKIDVTGTKRASSTCDACKTAFINCSTESVAKCLPTTRYYPHLIYVVSQTVFFIVLETCVVLFLFCIIAILVKR
jgi:hypothetical protein